MKQIAAALVKAQTKFGPALKTSSNPHFKSRYADLAACVEAVIEALNANGIFLMQAAHECEHGVMVETLFIHESGEQLSAGKLHVPASKQDAQGYGSALTYARRYSLMAACGIAPEDDDGNAAAKSAPRRHPALVTDSFRSSATMDENGTAAIDLLPADEREYMRELAVEIVALVASEQPAEAWHRVEGEHLEAEQKMALWNILDSKTRAAIRKAGKQLKEAA